MHQREARRRRQITHNRNPLRLQRRNHLMRLRKKRILIPAVDERTWIIRRHPRDGVHAVCRVGSLVLLLSRHHPHRVRNHREARCAQGVDVVVTAVQNHAAELLLRYRGFAADAGLERGIGVV